MKLLLNYFLVFFTIAVLASCEKDCINNPNDYRLSRVEYFNTDGTLDDGFKNLFYGGGSLTRIDLLSGNSQFLEYENNKVIRFNNMLLGVPFPITSSVLKYSVTGQLEKVIHKSAGATGQATENDTLLFTWVGSKLLNVTSKAVDAQTGQAVSEEKLVYTYSGNNITRCVFEGTNYRAFTSGPISWKDSVDFQYDTLPNRFSENGISFFLQEFAFINMYQNTPLRIEYAPHLDPFWFDPAFFPFIQSENNVVKMKSKRGLNNHSFKYVLGTGNLTNKITEIWVNDRVATRYHYKRF